MGEVLYEQFRKERLIVKTKGLFQFPISRTSLMTFKVLEVKRKSEEKKKQKRIDSIQAQRCLDISEIMILRDCSNTI